MWSFENFLIATKTNRVITETTVDFLFMDQQYSFKIGVVCTCADGNIDTSIVIHLENEDRALGTMMSSLHKNGLYDSRSRAIGKSWKRGSLRFQVATWRREAVKAAHREGSSKTQTRYRDLERESQAFEAQLLPFIQENLELLVHDRSAITIRRSEKKSDHLLTADTLEVIWVLNLQYWTIKEARVINGPHLSIYMTSISAALRSYNPPQRCLCLNPSYRKLHQS